MTIQHIQLSEHTQELVDSLVKSGVGPNAEAVVESAVEQYASTLVALRTEVRRGFDDLDEGRCTDLNGDDELHAHFAKLSAEAADQAAHRRAEAR